MFGPYLESLPSQYTNPYFCSDKEKLCLPQSLSEKVLQQEKLVQKNYHQLLSLTQDLNWTLRPTLAEFSWAWFTVNTRAVYLDRDPRWPGGRFSNSSDDSLGEILIPFKMQQFVIYSPGALP